MLFQKRKKPRQFSYTPFYLKDEKDSSGRSVRIKFKRTRIGKQKKGFPIFIVILAIIVFLGMMYLKNIGQ